MRSSYIAVGHLMTARNNPTWAVIALLLPCGVVLVLHAGHYWPFISDDALISLRYAKRFLDGYGLTWTEGRPVEGYSNLLWILLVSLLGAFGVDLILAARLLGGLGMMAIMASLLYWHAKRAPMAAVWFPTTLALLFLSLGAPMAVWMIGGLEQPLFGALLAISIPLMFSVLESREMKWRTLSVLSLVLGLLCLTRPDGPLFAVSAAAALFLDDYWSGRPMWARRAVLVMIFPALFFLAQLTFRITYYGELVPNTALVKITPSVTGWRGGFDYLTGGLRALSPFSLVAIASLLGLLVTREGRGKAVYLLLSAASWSAYVVFVGGDIFPAYRHFVPLMVIFAFALAEGTRTLVQRLASRPRSLAVVMIAAFILVVPYAWRQFTDKQSRRAVSERWEWEGRELGLLLKSAFSRQQPLLAVTAAGCLPYWSDLPAVDMLGLNDYYLPRHSRADIEGGFPGHELGDGRYVLSRNPDIMVFNIGSPPHYRSGAELETMAEFHERYVPVTVRVPSLENDPIIYFNKYSTKVGIGILRSPSAITIPGFLFRGDTTIAYLNGARKLVVQLTRGHPAHIRFESTELLDEWVVDVRGRVREALPAQVKQHGGSVSVILSSNADEPVEIEEVVLRRPS